jgi:hypothetical protein
MSSKLIVLSGDNYQNWLADFVDVLVKDQVMDKGVPDNLKAAPKVLISRNLMLFAFRNCLKNVLYDDLR